MLSSNSNSKTDVFFIFKEFAADYAKDFLVQNLLNKIIEASNILKGISTPPSAHLIKTDCADDEKDSAKSPSTLTQRKASFRKSYTDDCVSTGNCNRDQEVFLNKLNSNVRNKESLLNNNNNNNVKPQTFGGKCYIENGKINFGKMLTDEVLAADFELVKVAKKTVSQF